jgi:hypothetical protein
MIIPAFLPTFFFHHLSHPGRSGAVHIPNREFIDQVKTLEHEADILFSQVAPMFIESGY